MDLNKLDRRAIYDNDLGIGNAGTGFYVVHLVRSLNDEGEQMKSNRAWRSGYMWSNPNDCQCGLYDGHCGLCGKQST